MKRQESTQLNLFILSILIAIISIISSLVGIVGLLGIYGSIGAIISILILIYVLTRIFRPILSKTMRGETLLQAIASVGLMDIENRDDKDVKKSLPPIEYYRLAKSEIVITGLSAFQTFDKYIDELHDILKSGKKIFVMIVHPDSPDILPAGNVERIGLRGQIIEAINMAKEGGVMKYSNFQLKLMDRIPPYTAVMIDGDLEGKTPKDDFGQIRVQPVTRKRTIHSGLVIQLRKKLQLPMGAFDYFAEDVRNQWKDCEEVPETFILNIETI